MTTKLTTKAFSHYPEDRDRLLAMAQNVLDYGERYTDIETLENAAIVLADIVQATLRDEALIEYEGLNHHERTAEPNSFSVALDEGIAIRVGLYNGVPQRYYIEQYGQTQKGLRLLAVAYTGEDARYIAKILRMKNLLTAKQGD